MKGKWLILIVLMMFVQFSAVSKIKMGASGGVSIGGGMTTGGAATGAVGGVSLTPGVRRKPYSGGVPKVSLNSDISTLSHAGYVEYAILLHDKYGIMAVDDFATQLSKEYGVDLYELIPIYDTKGELHDLNDSQYYSDVILFSTTEPIDPVPIMIGFTIAMGVVLVIGILGIPIIIILHRYEYKWRRWD